MDKPICKLCGTKHWSREPCLLMSKPSRAVAAPRVTKVVPISVTKVGAKMGRPTKGDQPMSAAERMKQYRARKRATG
jgi:hypothetical protein